MFSFLRTSCFLPLIFLQACGSSSSSEPEVVQPDKEYKFSLSASYSYACGNQEPVTNVELLLQDNNWQTIESYLANENGEISFVTSSQYINYTIVARDVDENFPDDTQGLDIASFHQTLAESHYQYRSPFEPTVSSDECQCTSQDLVLRHRSFATITQASSSLSYQSLSQIDEQTTQFNRVEVCRVSDGSWPVASFMVAGFNTDGEAIAAGDFLTDFTSNEQGIWQLAAVEVANTELLMQEHDNFTHQQLFTNGQHFTMQVAENAEQTLVFENHSYTSESQFMAESVQLLKLTDSVFGSSQFESLHQKISTQAEDVFTVEAVKSAPDLDDSFYSEIASDGSYDYSAVTHYPMAIITFDYIAYSPTTELMIPVVWRSYGGISGTLPSSVNLPGYDDIINQDNDIFKTQVILLRSLESDTYQDYLNFYQGIDDIDFDHNLLRYILTLTLN